MLRRKGLKVLALAAVFTATGCRRASDDRVKVVKETVAAFVGAVAVNDTSVIRRLAWTDSIAKKYVAIAAAEQGRWRPYAAARLNPTRDSFFKADTALVYFATEPKRLACIDVPGPNSGVSAQLLHQNGSWRVLWLQLEPVIC